MIIRFNNLGVLKRADIDLSAPFIVFTGPNGTGKTYLSYALYQLRLSLGGRFMEMAKKEGDRIKSFTFEPELLETEDEINSTLDAKGIYGIFLSAIKEVSLTLLSDIHLNIQNHNFSIQLLSSEDAFVKELLALKLDDGLFLKYHKQPGSLSFSVKALKGYRKYEGYTKDYPFQLAFLLNTIFFSGDSSATMFTAERLGISMFSKELSIGRLKYNYQSSIRYPSPISDSLAEVEDRKEISKRSSAFASFADDLENSILKGVIGLDQEGELYYEKGGLRINVKEGSSTVKALSEFVFYLRHKASKMSLLIVDEPEIHLHPDNQIILARIFAKMVNKGIRLLISTHSDYIIHELNNMIMLNSLNKLKSNSFGHSSDEFIDKDDLRVYLFNWGKGDYSEAKEVNVAKDGFAIETIDEAINQINVLSDNIYEALVEND